MSQQARFSAARPSDSPKGPVVSLAEEADYDEAQARLAGIQRLLVIAGYDANPIDGVQGAKTQAALTKFLSDRKLASDAASAPEFFATLLDAARNPEVRASASPGATTPNTR
ncbi:MAG TPA: peptidoglycan-binding domain-containing protein [Pseudolabrys sp.]